MGLLIIVGYVFFLIMWLFDVLIANMMFICGTTNIKINIT